MLLDSSTDAYAAATRPHNSSTVQRPARVAALAHADEMVDALREVRAMTPAGDAGVRIAVQATGHGAGASVDDSVVLFDTSGLSAVSIDPDRRTATVGAGATWGAVNAAAEQHGLLGPAGSAASVSVSGYTFGGGIGWLVRRDGLASGALRAVHYLDGDGRLRTASDDAEDPLDRDAIWAFRGAGGVGIAHALELDLFPAPDLHAGTLLWPGDALPGLMAAWADSIGQVGTSVSSSIAVLRVPPAPPFPDALRGAVAVHLSVADPEGPHGAASLLEAMRTVAPPVVDDWGPKDAAGLARIHLDPPGATPALGDARWLTDATPTIARALLEAAASDGAAVVMTEIRHVGGAPTRGEGALVAPPGPFLFHAVSTTDRFDRASIESTFRALRDVWDGADAGVTPGSWIEGASSVPDALPAPVRRRARAVADAVDPDGLFRRSRLLG